MRVILLMLGFCLGMLSCSSNYKTEDLYGNWQGETMGMTLNEDGSAELRLDGGARKVNWRDAMGNTLEITSGGKVIMSNLTVKRVTTDTLVIETREIIGKAGRTAGETTHTMVRVQ